MNKYLSYVLFGAVALIALASCKKNNLVVGKTLDVPSFVKIGTWLTADTSGTYAVKPTNEPFKIPIGVTNVSNKDRTVTFTYSSATAVEGVDFTAPASIVLKAGQSLDSLPITGKYSSFGGSVTKSHVVKVTISGGDIAVNSNKFNYNLTMKMYFAPDPATFSGTYICQDYESGVPDGGPYLVQVNPSTASGPVTSVNIIGLFGVDNPPVKVTMTWNTLTSGTTLITPMTNWFEYSPAYEKVAIEYSTVDAAGVADKGTFTSTPNKFSARYKPTLVLKSTGAKYTFGNYTSVFTKN